MDIVENKKTIKTQFIFWCFTSGHEEDWFIQANSKLEAQEAHADFEGFDIEEVKSRKVCEVPRTLHIKGANWPKTSLLKKLGFEFLQTDSPRIVRYNGKLFKEGTLVEILTDYEVFKKPQTYLVKVRGKDFYKIGFSSDLYRRKKEILGNLYQYLEHKTAIIITHRIFSLFDFDRIVVLEEGKIVETGTHTELLALNGYYTYLYEQQQAENSPA